jgi:hypothetical protein
VHPYPGKNSGTFRSGNVISYSGDINLIPAVIPEYYY